MTTPHDDLPERFRAELRDRDGRYCEFIDSRHGSSNGSDIPDYWFEAHHGGRDGVRMAADQLRPFLPQFADAVVEYVSHVRIVEFSRSRRSTELHTGLFYMSNTRTSGPVAVVGFLPNPRPLETPKFWDNPPSVLRELTTTVHDGLVEDSWFDNGVDRIADWMTMEEYASVTGVLDDVGPIYASNAAYEDMDIADAPRPPELGVVGHNGRRVAYMFEIADPTRNAWSFGDDYLMQKREPVAELLDSIMAVRLGDSSVRVDPDGNSSRG